MIEKYSFLCKLTNGFSKRACNNINLNKEGPGYTLNHASRVLFSMACIKKAKTPRNFPFPYKKRGWALTRCFYKFLLQCICKVENIDFFYKCGRQLR